MAMTSTTDHHDDYWKLDDYGKHTAKQMKALLDQRGYYNGSLTDKAKLRLCLRRADLGLMSYQNCTNDELRKLIAMRKTDNSTHHEGQREYLLRYLHGMDEQPEFHRFVDLPAELRNKVYAYYFAEFRQPIYAPSQPPLSMTCRLIRQETLRMFYSMCTFEVRLFRVIRGGGRRESRDLTMDSSQLLFIRSIAPEHVAAIRHLSFSVGLKRRNDTMMTCTDALDSLVPSRVDLS